MAPTRDSKKNIRARAKRDPKVRQELLRERVESPQSGEPAKTVFSDYIDALAPVDAIKLGIIAAKDGRLKPAREALPELQRKLANPDQPH